MNAASLTPCTRTARWSRFAATWTRSPSCCEGPLNKSMRTRWPACARVARAASAAQAARLWLRDHGSAIMALDAW